MVINFSVGDFVIPNTAFVEDSLKQATVTTTLRQALVSLGNINCVPSEVTATGMIGTPVKSFIRVVPANQKNIAFKNGNGIVIYFDTESQLNNAFELSTAFLKDKCFVKVLNSSGSTITKNSMVRQTGFNSTAQQAIIALADATTTANAIVFGVAMEDIANGTSGAVLTDGSYQTDTSSFTLNNEVFLSDTPGGISTTPGTENVIVGRVLSVAITGTISFFSTLTGGGSGSGLGLFTEGTGAFSAVGIGSPAPTSTAGGSSLVHGSGSVIDSKSFDVVAIGRYNKIYGSYRGLVVGRSNTIGVPGGVYGQFLSEVLCVGRGNYLGTAGTGGPYRCAAIGRSNVNNGFSDCFTFGRGNNTYHTGPVNGTRTTIFGRNNSANTDESFINGLGNYGYAENNAIFGTYNAALGGTTLVSGYSNDVRSPFTLVVGNNNYAVDVTYPQGGIISIVGYNCSAVGDQSSLVGYGCQTEGIRNHAHGLRAHALRDNQRTWSAGRNVLGSAQYSFITDSLQTTDATQTTITTLNLEQDKTYAVWVRIVVRNTTTNGENAIFTLDPVLAHRDTAGSAVLTGGTAALTRTDSGGGSTAWLADFAASGNNLLLRIIGDALDTLEWFSCIWFEEVSG